MMQVTKSFERKGKRHHERFYVVDGKVSYYICCCNGEILNTRKRITESEDDISEGWAESPLTYQELTAMANTKHEHAGNADLHRAIQFNPAARCESCHYPVAEDDPDSLLSIVALPHDRALFCQKCIRLAKDAGDTDLKELASLMRTLPPESEKANDAYLARLDAEADGFVQVSETGKQDLTLHHDDGTKTEMTGGTMFIKRKEKQDDQS